MTFPQDASTNSRARNLGPPGRWNFRGKLLGELSYNAHLQILTNITRNFLWGNILMLVYY